MDFHRSKICIRPKYYKMDFHGELILLYQT